MKNIVIATSGTGGHIYPAIAIRNMLSDKSVYFIVNKGSIGEYLLRELKFPHHVVNLIGFPRKVSLKVMTFFIKLLLGIYLLYRTLTKIKPDLIIGMGGFVSFPAVFIGWLLGIPCIIHEQNSKLGLANKICAIFAKEILFGLKPIYSFPAFLKRKIRFTGNPLRIEELKRTREKGLEFFGFDENKFTIFVFGGSQGAHALNVAFVEAIKDIKRDEIQVVHITGKSDESWVREKYKSLGIKFAVFSFLKEIGYAYAVADLVICRAGAMSVTELIYFKKPAILIPYPFSTEKHQYCNAYLLSKNKCAIFLNEKDIEKLRDVLTNLIKNRGKMDEMSKNYKNLEIPCTDEIFKKVISKYA